MSGNPRLCATVLEALYAHAQAGYPEEVCGFVIAEKIVHRCENRQNALHAEDPKQFPRNARTAYNLGAKDLFFLNASLHGDEPVTAIYHSHIDVGAYFSDEDALAAAPEGELLYPVDFIVIDIRQDGARGAKRFRFAEGQFVQIASYDR